MIWPWPSPGVPLFLGQWWVISLHLLFFACSLILSLSTSSPLIDDNREGLSLVQSALCLEFQVLPTQASTFLRDLSPSTPPSALVPDLPSKILRTLLPFKCLSSVSCPPPTAAVHLSFHSSRVSLGLSLGLHSLLFPLPSPGGSRPLRHH